MPNPVNQLISTTGLTLKCPSLFGWADIHAPQWDRKISRDVGWIIGAFMMTRRDLVDKIGLLDEAFFFYGEDVEFCHRVWKSGHRVRFDPGAEIIHFGGGSSSTQTAPDLNRENRMLTGKYLVQRICFGRWAFHVVRTGDYFMTLFRLLADRFRKNRRPDERQNLIARLNLIKTIKID
jgi:GT2 family glycosyltransferase